MLLVMPTHAERCAICQQSYRNVTFERDIEYSSTDKKCLSILVCLMALVLVAIGLDVAMGLDLVQGELLLLVGTSSLGICSNLGHSVVRNPIVHATFPLSETASSHPILPGRHDLSNFPPMWLWRRALSLLSVQTYFKTVPLTFVLGMVCYLCFSARSVSLQ